MPWDTLTPKERSEKIARVRTKNMHLELIVRSVIFKVGYRCRLHARDLLGLTGLVFKPRHKVIFVHGCFWRRHPNWALGRMPKWRLDFWRPFLTGEWRLHGV